MLFAPVSIPHPTRRFLCESSSRGYLPFITNSTRSLSEQRPKRDDIFFSCPIFGTIFRSAKQASRVSPAHLFFRLIFRHVCLTREKVCPRTTRRANTFFSGQINWQNTFWPLFFFNFHSTTQHFVRALPSTNDCSISRAKHADKTRLRTLLIPQPSSSFHRSFVRFLYRIDGQFSTLFRCVGVDSFSSLALLLVPSGKMGLPRIQRVSGL